MKVAIWTRQKYLGETLVQLQRCEQVWEKYGLTTWYLFGWVIAVYIGWSNGRPGMYLNSCQITQEHLGCTVRIFCICHKINKHWNHCKGMDSDCWKGGWGVQTLWMQILACKLFEETTAAAAYGRGKWSQDLSIELVKGLSTRWWKAWNF